MKYIKLKRVIQKVIGAETPEPIVVGEEEFILTPDNYKSYHNHIGYGLYEYFFYHDDNEYLVDIISNAKKWHDLGLLNVDLSQCCSKPKLVGRVYANTNGNGADVTLKLPPALKGNWCSGESIIEVPRSLGWVSPEYILIKNNLSTEEVGIDEILEFVEKMDFLNSN